MQRLNLFGRNSQFTSQLDGEFRYALAVSECPGGLRVDRTGQGGKGPVMHGAQGGEETGVLECNCEQVDEVLELLQPALRDDDIGLETQRQESLQSVFDADRQPHNALAGSP